MPMMPRGASRVFVLLVALLALGAVPGAASACVEPTAGPDGGFGADGLPSAGPNSPVGFVLTSDEGATFDVTVEGSVIDRGQDLDGRSGYHGQFAMPDLGGDERVVWVTISITHTDHTDASLNVSRVPSSFRVKYTPPVAAPAEPQSPSAAPTGPTGEAPSTPVHEQPGTPTSGGTPGSQPGARPGGGHDGPGALPHSGGEGGATAQPLHQAAPIERARMGGEPAAAAILVGREREPASEGPARIALAQPLGHPRRDVASTPASAVPVTPQERDGAPDWWVVAVALLMGLAIAAFALRFRAAPAAPQRPTPSPPRPAPVAPTAASGDPVEAELQELIAEERARQMDLETAAIRTGPG